MNNGLGAGRMIERWDSPNNQGFRSVYIGPTDWIMIWAMQEPDVQWRVLDVRVRKGRFGG